MRRLLPILLLTVVVLLGSAGEGWSADLQKATDAYKRGDYATAIRERKPLAEQGDAYAQSNLGQMYRKGQGVPQDDKTAVKWYRLAVEQGDASAQGSLGLMYYRGKGVPQDHKTAAKWSRLGAEQGNASAQGNLSAMYAFGKGVPKDSVYAHMWGNLGASKGNEKGAELRDLVAKKMTPSQLEKAQKLARECVRKKYKGC